MILLCRIHYLFFIFLLISLTSCLPIPTTRQALDVQATQFEIDPDSVVRETVFVAGFQEPHTPVKYNGSMVSKYTRPASSVLSKTVSNSAPKTIVVMMPGIYAGATTLELLASQLVAAQSNLEVWIIDRRSNLLEDTSVLRRSIATGDAMLSYDYYVKYYGKQNGYSPPKAEAVDFMQYWGLELHLADLHEVIKQAASESEQTYLLGHSLGAGLISFYTSFQVNQTQAGEDFIDGLILLDGVLGRTGGFGGIQWFNGLLDIAPQLTVDALSDSAIEESTIDEGVLNLQNLTGFNTFIPVNPREYVRSATVALLARFDPEGLSPFYDFPITNRAVLGVSIDDSFEVSTVFGASVGDIKDASLSGNIIPVLLDGDIGVYSKAVNGVAEGAEKVTWNSTLAGKEVCDIDQFAYNHSNELGNYNEWYFPVELMLDIAGYSMTLEDAEGFRATADVRVPTLQIGAERGLVQELDIFAAYNNLRVGSLISSYVVDDFTHLDIMCAQVNPATTIVLGWLEQLHSLRLSN